MLLNKWNSKTLGAIIPSIFTILPKRNTGPVNWCLIVLGSQLKVLKEIHGYHNPIYHTSRGKILGEIVPISKTKPPDDHDSCPPSFGTSHVWHYWDGVQKHQLWIGQLLAHSAHSPETQIPAAGARHPQVKKNCLDSFSQQNTSIINECRSSNANQYNMCCMVLYPCPFARGWQSHGLSDRNPEFPPAPYNHNHTIETKFTGTTHHWVGKNFAITWPPHITWDSNQHSTTAGNHFQLSSQATLPSPLSCRTKAVNGEVLHCGRKWPAWGLMPHTT